MARWIVDGWNVIGSRPDGWWKDRDAAVRRLVSRLDGFARDTGDDVTVVIDGHEVEGAEAQGVDVRFARDADDLIVQLVAEDDDPASLCVVTSDRELADRVQERGAEVTGGGGFRDRLNAYD